jgi:hypothetical protein
MCLSLFILENTVGASLLSQSLFNFMPTCFIPLPQMMTDCLVGKIQKCKGSVPRLDLPLQLTQWTVDGKQLD